MLRNKTGASLDPADLQFIHTTFTTLVALEAIVFGVFGFMYSVYAMFSSVTDRDGERAPICNIIRRLSYVLSSLISLNAVLAGYALYLIWPATDQLRGLGIAMIIIIYAIPVVSWWITLLME